MATAAPSEARRFAIPAPMPREPPVMSATFSFKLDMNAPLDFCERLVALLIRCCLGRTSDAYLMQLARLRSSHFWGWEAFQTGMPWAQNCFRQMRSSSRRSPSLKVTGDRNFQRTQGSAKSRSILPPGPLDSSRNCWNGPGSYNCAKVSKNAARAITPRVGAKLPGGAKKWMVSLVIYLNIAKGLRLTPDIETIRLSAVP